MQTKPKTPTMPRKTSRRPGLTSRGNAVTSSILGQTAKPSAILRARTVSLSYAQTVAAEAAEIEQQCLRVRELLESARRELLANPPPREWLRARSQAASGRKAGCSPDGERTQRVSLYEEPRV